MGKSLLVLAAVAFMVGQADEGVVTSTDLVAPDVSASERDGQAPAQQPERAAPAIPREEVPAATEPAVEPAGEAKETAEETEDTQEKPAAPREVTSDEARRHKAVAAFWFILPES